MPEGDTVHLTARRLHAALAGKLLRTTDLRVPQLATVDLAGRKVIEVIARGKHLLCRFEGDLTLHSHLRMQGSWHLYRPGSRWRGPGHEVRAVLGTESWIAVGFRLPVLELIPTTSESGVVGHLGPDVLGTDWDPEEARRRLMSDPDRSIAEALLDQRVMAGPGNVYKSEACFLAGIHPHAAAVTLPDPQGFISLVKRLMEANRDTGSQVTTGDPRPGRSHWVYGRKGLPCRRCGAPVLREGTDDGERVTYFCPRCQPRPDARHASVSPQMGQGRDRPGTVERKNLVIGEMLGVGWDGSQSSAWLGRLLVEEGVDLLSADSSDLQRGTPVFVNADADAVEVQRRMALNHIRMLPVVKDREVLGVIDLVELAMREDLADSTAEDAAS